MPPKSRQPGIGTILPRGAWINVGITYAGLEKIVLLTWEAPFRTDDLHLAIAIFAPDQEMLIEALGHAKSVYHQLEEISLLYELEIASPENGRTHMGFTDVISNPSIEGNKLNSPLKGETPLQAGEFIIGKKNEMEQVEEGPSPHVLGHNGSYLALRKLHMRVASFRSYLHQKGDSTEEKELLAAKMGGRWPSGAPLSLSPDQDNPELTENVNIRNDFLYKDDPKGLKCPLSAHVRRVNPRDSLEDSIADVNIHRLLRRSTIYGSPLPEGELNADGKDRGLILAGICTSLSRQYEFIKSTWLNDGNLIDLSGEDDPITGNQRHEGDFTIPDEPFRKRMHGIPSFTVTKRSAYFFVPSISALHWLSTLKDL